MYIFSSNLQKHQLCLTKLIILGATLLVAACSTIARFSDNSTIELSPSATETFTLNVSNWSDRHSLTLINGGPYRENSLQLSIGVRLLARTDQTLVAIDNNNDLHLVDFAVNPAKQLLQTPLEDEVTAIAVQDKDIFVATKKLGVFKYKLVKNKAIKKSLLNSAKEVSNIKIQDNFIYLLANDKIIKQALIQTTTVPNTQTWNLPGKSHDFALLNEFLVLVGPEFGFGTVNTSEPGKFISEFKLQGEQLHLSVIDKLALVADGTGGMLIVDLQDANKPRWLGSHNKFSSIQKLAVAKQKAFVIDRKVRVSSINIANNELPITGSFYKPDSEIHDLTLGDNGDNPNHSVFIATSSGIEKIIFPTTIHGQISNEGINQGGTRRAFIANKLAYVADWFSGLHIYDIANPSQLRHIGNMHTPGSSKGVVVEDGYAYVGDDDYGLQIIDVKNPANPVTVGSVLTTGLAYTLKKRGDLIFLADHRGGFHIINVKDVTKPFIVSSHNTQGKSWAIDVKDNVVFVADDTSGLLVFEISDINKPNQIGQFNPDGQAEDVVVRDNIAYVSFFDKGLYLLDISRPQQPRLISQLDIPGNARSVVLQNEYAYVAGWESGLHIVDISDTHAPKIVGSYDTKGSAWGADVDGNYVYVWDWWGGVKVIDTTIAARPTLLSKYHANSFISKLRQKENFIYTANNAAGIQVFDVNNVLNPIWSTGIDSKGNILDIWPAQHLPYLLAVSDQEGLLLLDISDPFYISIINQFKLAGTAKLVREHHGNIFVATKEGELIVFQVNQDHKLQKTQTLKLDVNDLWIDQKLLFVASSVEGLITLALDAQGHIKPHKKIVNHETYKVGASGKYIAAATSNYGVDIWKRTSNGIKPLTNINIDGKILGLVLDNTNLFVLTNTTGLMHYEISTADFPNLVARYPSTDVYSDILLHSNAVFFSGQDTIASVQLLPKLKWKMRDDGKLQVRSGKKLPVGNYHLAITDLKGNEELWPNAISVKLKKSGKPKLSIEDFQKLLEQHRKNQ